MVEYDPFSEEVIRGDKFAVYKRLRDEAPVHHNERWDCYSLSRFEDIWVACGDAESFSAARGTTASHLLTKFQPVTPMLNLMDPPDHTRLRAKLRRAFMPARVRAIEPSIRTFVADAIADFADRGECDAVSEFAQIVGTLTACTVAGFPREDSELLLSLVGRFFARDPESDGMTDDGLAALTEMMAYFVQLSAAHRRRGPVWDACLTDPLSILQDFRQGGKPLDDQAIASHLSLILIGGTDTFPKVFANLLLRLGENPDQRRQVVADPGLARAAFNEALRIDMPTQLMMRTIVKEVSFCGKTLPAGRPVIFIYGSANRDEREFNHPDRFDIHRNAPRTLSFGQGVHACIGLHVARKEGEIALQELLSRFPNYEVDVAGLERYRTEFVQGYSRMPVRWR